jgi:hypothetical protein
LGSWGIGRRGLGIWSKTRDSGFGDIEGYVKEGLDGILRGDCGKGLICAGWRFLWVTGYDIMWKRLRFDLL